MPHSTESLASARGLLDFVDASPTPWHAVAAAETLLNSHGFSRLEESHRWSLLPGERYYVVRGGGSLIAFIVGSAALAETGLRIVGAHTDSPGLRIKPRPLLVGDGLLRLAVEVYGGPVLATFTDRDLAIAGRVVVRSGAASATRLLRFDQPMVRLPNLAMHMNREVNEQGLRLNRQTELPVILAASLEEQVPLARWRQLLAERAQVDAEDLLSWDLALFDVQPGSFWGIDNEFIASGRLDNLASCHAAIEALLGLDRPDATCMVALFDHEEVGSESAVGAAGSFAADVIARLTGQAGLDGEDRARALARSFLVSVDMAHAYQPNFPGAYEPGHKVMVNQGPVIKIHAGQRYASNAETSARFMVCCEQAGVPCQHYSHRGDLACGSTIGPLVAARLGIATVDVGAAMWAMHSLRESAGALDPAYMTSALKAVFASQ